MAAIPLLFLLLTAPVRAQSALDGFDPGANNFISAFAVQADGKVVVGGSFTMLGGGGTGTIPRNYIARLNPDGTIDASFNPAAGFDVYALAVQTDGKILVGGIFSSIGGSPRSCIARLNADGTLDASFNPGANIGVYALALQPDGKILVGGGFTMLGGGGTGTTPRVRLGRLNSDGTLDTGFDPGANATVYAFAVQPDGKILTGGQFTMVGGGGSGTFARSKIARLNSNGTLDNGFDPGASDFIRTLKVQADGKILVGGNFTTLGGGGVGTTTRNKIGRLNSDGTLDGTFDPGANNGVESLVLQSDGKILVGGFFSMMGGGGTGTTTRHGIARLTPSGALDASFDPGAGDGVIALALQADGKILVGGLFTALGGGTGTTPRSNIGRLYPDGRVDQTVNLGAVGNYVTAVAVQPDGKFLIGGLFSSILGVPRNSMARVNADGTLDMGFNPNANSTVDSIVVQADGKILVSGFFTNIGGQPRNRIARLDATTGSADSFNPNADERVLTMAMQADGKILAGGEFANIGGQTRSRIARLDPATGLADSFDPGGASVFTIYSMAVQADGKILAGGDFVAIGGQPRNKIARLDPATGLADSFNPNADSTVYSIAVQADGKVLAGGNFTNIGGQPRSRIARLDANTGLADSFNPNAGFVVYAIAAQADGKVLAGGEFVTIGGQPRNRIARLNGTTGLADSFNPNSDGFVYSTVPLPDGKVLAGGNFNNIGSQPRPILARLSNDSAALQDLVVTQTAVTWIHGGSGPTLTRVTFESSADNVNYAPLGNGTATGSNWTLTGLSLPIGQTFYIRARGYYRTGSWGGSGSIMESVRNTFLAAPSGTPTPSPTPPTPTPTPTSTPAPTGTPTPTSTPPTPSPTPTPSSTPTPPGTPSPSPTPPVFTPTPTASPTPPATPTVSPPTTPTPTPTASPTPTATSTPTATPGTLGNISTRLRVLSGDNVLIGGMIATGTGGTRVILRAIGPSLADLGVPGALQDPTLELFQGSTLLMSNDDWQNSSQQAEIAASGFAPSHAEESAIIWTLTPGQGYTAIVRGKNNTTGVGVVEAYDLDHSPTSKLGNISTRGFVDVDNNVMIAGVIVGPGNGTSARVLARALGPTLSDFGVPGALADTTLDLVNSSGTVVRSNDNWKDDPLQRSAIKAAGLAPGHDEEAALVETVAPGAYTAIVRGSNRTTGVGLVEVYHIQ